MYLWYELSNDVDWFLEVGVIAEGETDTEQHVHHSQYHTQLHLEWVQEVQLIIRHLPDLKTLILLAKVTTGKNISFNLLASTLVIFVIIITLRNPNVDNHPVEWYSVF